MKGFPILGMFFILYWRQDKKVLNRQKRHIEYISHWRTDKRWRNEHHKNINCVSSYNIAKDTFYHVAWRIFVHIVGWKNRLEPSGSFLTGTEFTWILVNGKRSRSWWQSAEFTKIQVNSSRTIQPNSSELTRISPVWNDPDSEICLAPISTIDGKKTVNFTVDSFRNHTVCKKLFCVLCAKEIYPSNFCWLCMINF